MFKKVATLASYAWLVSDAINRHFHVFFDIQTWTRQGISVDTTGKSPLELVKLPSLRLICLISELKYIDPQSCKNVQTFISCGVSCSPPDKKACKITRLWGDISLLVLKKSPSNLAILLIKRRSFLPAQLTEILSQSNKNTPRDIIRGNPENTWQSGEHVRTELMSGRLWEQRKSLFGWF